VAGTAREHGVNANRVLDGRRQLLLGAGPRAQAEPRVSLVRVMLGAAERGDGAGALPASVAGIPVGGIEGRVASVRRHGAVARG
jgi:hypothetical protein